MIKATGLRYSNAEWNSGLRRIASWLHRGTHISEAAIVVVIDRFHQNIIEIAHIAREELY
jgi:hypothetical protein